MIAGLMFMSACSMQKIKAEPNLTPMLDMVFQLITFFMLVINFKSAALDLSLRLPVVGSARPVDTKGMEDLLILNITQDGKLIVYGISQGYRKLHSRRGPSHAALGAANQSGLETRRRIAVDGGDSGRRGHAL